MKTIGRFIAFVGCVLFVLWAGVRIYKIEVTWAQNVHGHLKRAADANTLELAKKELETAVRYLEDNGITSGYTSVIWNTPDEDVSFWYRNLKESVGELKRCEEECKDQLAQTNVLMKLRETLLDEGQGMNVTEPSGISIFPSNTGYMWWAIISLISAVFGFIVVANSDY